MLAKSLTWGKPVVPAAGAECRGAPGRDLLCPRLSPSLHVGLHLGASFGGRDVLEHLVLSANPPNGGRRHRDNDLQNVGTMFPTGGRGWWHLLDCGDLSILVALCPLRLPSFSACSMKDLT